MARSYICGFELGSVLGETYAVDNFSNVFRALGAHRESIYKSGVRLSPCKPNKRRNRNPRRRLSLDLRSVGK